MQAELFSEVASKFIAGLDTAFCHRSSERLSDNTRRLYSRYATRAAASLGGLPLAAVTPLKVKDYISELKREDLADTTIVSHFGVLRSVIESVRDEYGNPIVPAKYNLGFLGLPVIKPEQLRAPIASVEDIERGISVGSEFGLLIAVLSATGIRISEAISIIIVRGTDKGHGNTYNPESGLISIRDGKTDAAERALPLTANLNRIVAQFASGRSGRLFKMSLSKLHHLLRKYNLPPAHSYRRFRQTHLRRSRVVTEIEKYLMGHSRRNDLGDRYSRLAADSVFVRSEVERAGLGFKI
jgi:integrase